METISNHAAALKEKASESREEADVTLQSIAEVEEQLPKGAEDARILLKNVAEVKTAVNLAYESGET